MNHRILTTITAFPIARQRANKSKKSPSAITRMMLKRTDFAEVYFEISVTVCSMSMFLLLVFTVSVQSIINVYYKHYISH